MLFHFDDIYLFILSNYASSILKPHHDSGYFSLLGFGRTEGTKYILSLGAQTFLQTREFHYVCLLPFWFTHIRQYYPAHLVFSWAFHITILPHAFFHYNSASCFDFNAPQYFSSQLYKCFSLGCFFFWSMLPLYDTSSPPKRFYPCLSAGL